MIGLVVVGVIAAVSLLVFAGVFNRALRPGGQTVRAVFASTGRLSPGDPVRIQGVRTGRVDSIHLDAGGRSSTVELTVFKEGLPLYADARAVIHWRTLLGGAFAIDIDRGSPGAGDLGDRTIPQSRTDYQAELDDVLTALREQQRSGLKTLLAEVPQALGDPDAPARVLDRLSRVSPTLARGVGAVRGTQPGDVSELVANTARTVRALDRPAAALRDVVEGAAATLQTTARREADIRATLTRGARALPQVGVTLTRLDHTLDEVDPLVDDLQRPVREIRPAIEALRPVAVDATQLLAEARPVLQALRPAVSSLSRASRTGIPVLSDLTPAIDTLAERVLPRLGEPDAVSKRAAYQMIGPTVATISSAAARFDSGGHLVKLSGQGGERPVQTLPCSTFLTDPTRQQLVSCELLSQGFGDLLGRTR
jgi:phospholipid/cholesterol/gamma-HCH transport system substrate-binding protein